MTAFPLKILDNVSSIGSGVGIAASSRRGLKFQICKNILNIFLTIPGIFESPHVYIHTYYSQHRDAGRAREIKITGAKKNAARHSFASPGLNYGSPFLWQRVASGKITVRDIPNHFNYCVIFVAYTQFTAWPRAAKYNLAARGLETHSLVLDNNSFIIHSVFCLTTGPKPPPKRCLHVVRSRASSFK